MVSAASQLEFLQWGCNLLVFCDGEGYLREDGNIAAGVVLDNLMSRAQIPLTVAIFINPGSAYLPTCPAHPLTHSVTRLAGGLADKLWLCGLICVGTVCVRWAGRSACHLRRAAIARV